MTTLTHGTGVTQPTRWVEALRVREMWAGIAIVAMWLAVLFDGIYGSDFVTTSAGGSTTTIPSAFLVGFFAFLGTVSVARYGLRQRGED